MDGYLRSSSLGVGIILSYIVYSIFKTLQKPSSRVPGPWHTKWTGLVLKYQWYRGQRTFYVHYLHEKYGKVVRIAPDQIDFMDINAVKTIYTTQEKYRKAAWYRQFNANRTHNMFNTDDVELHRRYRRLLGGPMTDSSLKTHVSQITSCVGKAMDGIRRDMAEHGAADIFKWSFFLATDVIGELTFGQSFQMLEHGKKNQYAIDLQNLQRMGAILSVFPWLLSLAPYLGLPITKRIATVARRMRGYASALMESYKLKVESDPPGAKQTLFTKVFQAEEADTLNFEEVMTNAQSYIVAGSNTTAHSLTYLIWSICRDARVRDELVKELQTLPEGFQEPDLRGLPHLDRVISEGLRLYGATPSGLPRVVPPGGAVISGYELEEGTVVCAQAYSMHRGPDVFLNPDTFDPSRWENATKEMRDSFMPFGKGARACIGSHLAMIELRLAIAHFFTQFPNATVSTHDGMCDEDMKPVIYFGLSPRGQRCLIDVS